MKSSKKIQVIVRGLAMRNDSVLVCEPIEGGYCYLPGGKVEPGEGSIDALRREFQEECGLDVEIGGLAAVSEERFVQWGKCRHEVNLVFHVELPSDLVVASREAEIKFRWISIAAVDECGLLPKSMRKLAVCHVEHSEPMWLGSSESVG